MGLFANTDFDEYDVLGQYTGIIKKSGTGGGDYVARFDKGSNFAYNIDALTVGNELRLIND